MDEETAKGMKMRGEMAIRELVSILDADQIKEHCSDEEFVQIKRGIGLSIALIGTELVSVVYRQYPELDPIKNS
ncbi:MAG: hypothetical protein AAB288_07185 [Acidobacteriota bacterium]